MKSRSQMQFIILERKVNINSKSIKWEKSYLLKYCKMRAVIFWPCKCRKTKIYDRNGCKHDKNVSVLLYVAFVCYIPVQSKPHNTWISQLIFQEMSHSLLSLLIISPKHSWQYSDGRCPFFVGGIMFNALERFLLQFLYLLLGIFILLSCIIQSPSLSPGCTRPAPKKQQHNDKPISLPICYLFILVCFYVSIWIKWLLLHFKLQFCFTDAARGCCQVKFMYLQLGKRHM